MGKKFLRLVQAAIAVGALVIPGCGGGDGTTTAADPTTAVQAADAPVVVSAELDEASVLTITFSRTVKPPVGVDPQKFRLTFAYYSTSTPYYYDYGNAAATASRTTYTDVSQFAHDANVVSQPGPSNQIVLDAGGKLDHAWVCASIAHTRQTQPKGESGLYLHYKEAGSPTIEGTEGSALASIAPYWLTDANPFAVPGDFASKPIPVSIKCP